MNNFILSISGFVYLLVASCAFAGNDATVEIKGRVQRQSEAVGISNVWVSLLSTADRSSISDLQADKVIISVKTDGAGNFLMQIPASVDLKKTFLIAGGIVIIESRSDGSFLHRGTSVILNNPLNKKTNIIRVPQDFRPSKDVFSDNVLPKGQ